MDYGKEIKKDSSLSKALKVMERVYDSYYQKIRDRIEEFKKTPPQASGICQFDDDYSSKIGVWRVPGGVIYITANKQGEYDPNHSVFIPTLLLKMFIEANDCEVLEPLAKLYEDIIKHTEEDD